VAQTEEIVAKYRLDLDELKTQVNELQGEFKKVDANAQKAGKGANDAFGKLGDQLKKLGGAVVAAFAAERIISFAKESVAAFAEAEQGVLKLRSAVSSRGGLQADFENLNQQAEDLSKRTIFDDDTIRAAQTLALQFGLNANAVQDLIPLVADFASATGQDLNGALQSVIGGINGQERALKAYGVTLDDASTRNERLATITEQLTEKFKGQGQALTETVGGSISQAGKAYDELKETIGESLGPLATNLAKSLTSIFKAFEDPPIEGLRQEQKELQTTALEIYGLQEGTDARTEAIKRLQSQYPEYLGSLKADKVSNDQLRAAIERVNNELTFKIAQQQIETELQPLREKAAATALEEADARRKLSEQLNTIYQRTTDLNDAKNNQTVKELQALDIAQQAYLLQQGAIQLTGISRVSLGGVSDAYEQLKVKSGEYAQAQVEVNDKIKEARERSKQLRETLGVPIRQNVTVTTTGLEGLTEEEKKAAAERGKQRKKELSEREKALQEAAAKEAKQTEDLRAQELKTSQEYLDLYLADQLLAIETRYNAERNAASTNAQKEQQALVDQLERGLITREQYEQKKAAILAKIPATEGQQAIEIAAAELTALQARLQNLQQYTVQRQELLQQASELETRLEAARAAKDPALVAALEQEKRVLEERLKLVADNAAERSKLEQTITEKSAQLEQLKTSNQLKESDTRTTNAEQEALRKQELLAKELADRRAFNEQVVALSQQLAGNLIDLGTQLSEQRIAQLEAEKETRLQDFEDQQAELTNQYEQRLIGQAQYEPASKDIANQKLKTEQDIAAKVKEIRRKEDAARKAQALFSISVDTAKAVQAQLATTPLPAGAPLVALIIASGLAQAGIVLSQKPPQYAEGVDWVPLGKNKKGRDTIPAMLDEGERVISRRKNLKHWDLYQAIDQDRLPEYVFRTYTLPALQQERDRSRQAFAQLTTAVARQAENVPTAALSATGDPAELRRLWRRGLSINNLDELVHLLTKHQPSPYRA